MDRREQEFTGVHDPILVPAAKMDAVWILWKWWCPCGKGGKSAQDYIDASRSALDHVAIKEKPCQN
jgi:hypothetical protein